MFRLRNYVFLFLLSAFCLGFSPVGRADGASLFPDGLTVEMLSNPIGIETQNPRLAWKNDANDGGYGYEQTAYRILVASDRATLDGEAADLWDSGWVASDRSIQIPYEGKPLRSDTRVFWKVRIKDQDGNLSPWSRPASWTTGILAPSDWQGKWIAQPERLRRPTPLDGVFWIGRRDCATPLVRKEFDLDVTQADLDAKKYTALLHYAGNKTFEIHLNGKTATHSFGMVFNPDLLRVADVTELLRPGKNLLAAKMRTDDGTEPAILLKLEIRELVPIDRVTPGRGIPGQTVLELKSDASWKLLSEPNDGWDQLEESEISLPQAAELWSPDAAPWGKLRRFADGISPAFQKTFRTANGKKVTRATLYISGLGFYEASLDGQKISGRLLDPSMTRYVRRVLYSAYDLTDRLTEEGGPHVLDVLLGHGWYDVRSTATWNFDAAHWRGSPRLLAQLNINYDDGTSEVIASDETWDTVTSPLIHDCIRQGEIVDGGFRQEKLGKAERIDPPGGLLTSSLFPGTVIVDEFPAVSVQPTKEPETWIVDLGRNIAGWCRVEFRGLEKGKVVRLRYSERLKEGQIERNDLALHFLEGSPAYFAGEAGGFQTDFYIAGGNPVEVFEPRFTYHGFQYLEVKGLSSAPNPEDFTACVVANGFPENGAFTTSNRLINDIQAATLSSYRANFVDGYPTDCPHREKNGWTGDAQLACEQAMYNWENSAAYEKWVRDLCDEQRPDGNLPGIVPTGGWGYAWGNGPSWDSALILVPWHLYVYRGDRRILETSYDAMKLYVDYLTTREDADRLVSHGLGDWCPYRKMPSVQVTTSSYYYVDAKIMAETAKMLGKTEDAEKYAALADRIRADYCRVLIDGATGQCDDGSLTAQSCPIHQGLVDALPEKEQKAVFDRLLDRLHAVDAHFDCGIFGAKYILRTLSEGGRTDLALRMVLQETSPCYADWIRRGAGTLWEDWGEGSSRNHVMFGDVSAWFYQYLAGIRLDGAPYPSAGEVPSAPGFRRSTLAPDCRVSDLAVPGKEPLRSVDAHLDTPYGRIVSRWDRDPQTEELTFEAVVPYNTRAKIFVPYDEGEEVLADHKIPESIRLAAEKVTDRGKPALLYEVGGGTYRFTVRKAAR